jgi:hypothetical protein
VGKPVQERLCYWGVRFAGGWVLADSIVALPNWPTRGFYGEGKALCNAAKPLYRRVQSASETHAGWVDSCLVCRPATLPVTVTVSPVDRE